MEYQKKRLATAAVMLALTAPATTLASSTTCTEAASEEQARALLSRLMPDAGFIEFSTLNTGSTSCLLEVEMLANANDPSTRGYIYVLPDGQRALNGPLLDKRSKLQISKDMEQNESLVAIQAAIENMTAQVLDANTRAAKISAPQNTDLFANTPSANSPHVKPTTEEEIIKKPYTPAPGETIQQTLLRELKKSPYAQGVQRTSVPNPAAQAYILYDSNCPACTVLYKAMDSIAEKHHVQFNWVPGYLNDAGWLLAAEAIRNLNLSNQDGVDAIRNNFEQPKPTIDQLELMAKNLTDKEFEQARASAVFLLRVNSMSPSPLGTPMIFIEGPTGKVVSAYGAVSSDKDWESLVRQAQ